MVGRREGSVVTMVLLALVGLLVGLGGCSDAPKSTAAAARFMRADSAISSAGDTQLAYSEATRGLDSTVKSLMHTSDQEGQDKQQNPLPSRKIIYNARVSLITEDFDAAERQLRQLIEQHGGMIASSEVQGQAGQQRTGRWKVRIPIAQFDLFKQAVEKVGNLERSSIDSQDVTEEFFDVEARIKNKKVEEERLIAHLKDTTGKLTDILEVEKELSRVRSEIERMQGRLNLLTNLTSLTTVEVSVQEIKNYRPPTAPTFGEDLSRTWTSSWESFVRFCRQLGVNLVSVVPWLPLWLVIGAVAYVPVRKLTRRLRGAG